MSNLRKTNRPYAKVPGEPTPLPPSASPPPVVDETLEALQARARALSEKLDTALVRASRLETMLGEAQRDLERTRQEARRGADAAAFAETRALLADESLGETTAALERTRMDREVDRARLIEIEAEVAMTKRDAAQSIEAALAVADDARRTAEGVQARLSRAEELAARAAEALTELERHEATATTDRLRAISRAKRILGGRSAEPHEG